MYIRGNTLDCITWLFPDTHKSFHKSYGMTHTVKNLLILKSVFGIFSCQSYPCSALGRPFLEIILWALIWKLTWVVTFYDNYINLIWLYITYIKVFIKTKLVRLEHLILLIENQLSFSTLLHNKIPCYHDMISSISLDSICSKRSRFKTFVLLRLSVDIQQHRISKIMVCLKEDRSWNSHPFSDKNYIGIVICMLVTFPIGGAMPNSIKFFPIYWYKLYWIW